MITSTCAGAVCHSECRGFPPKGTEGLAVGWSLCQPIAAFQMVGALD